MNRISYCWFHDPRTSNRPRGMYSRLAPAVFRAARAIYPDYELVVHIDSTVASEPYAPALWKLQAKGVLRLVECKHGRGISEASLWRLKPAWDMPDTDVLICRDLDSICTLRERWAVEAWINSGKVAHAINDHQAHTSPHWPQGALLTGTCGFRAGWLREKLGLWQDLIAYGVKHGMGMDAYGHDETTLNLCLQPFLSTRIYCNPASTRGGANIEPVPLPVDVAPQLYDDPKAFTEYIGMCLQEPERAVEWYDRIPSLAVFRECEA